MCCSEPLSCGLHTLHFHLQVKQDRQQTADAAVKSWARHAELAGGASGLARMTREPGGMPQPAGPPSPPPTEREGVAASQQTSRAEGEVAGAIEGCECDQHARAGRESLDGAGRANVPSPVTLDSPHDVDTPADGAEFGATTSAKKTLAQETSALRRKVAQLVAERDALVAALNSAKTLLSSQGMELPTHVVTALEAARTPRPRGRPRKRPRVPESPVLDVEPAVAEAAPAAASAVPATIPGQDEPQIVQDADPASWLPEEPPEVSGAGAARLIGAPAYLDWRRQRARAQATLRATAPKEAQERLVCAARPRRTPRPQLGWSRKMGLGDLELQIGKRGAAPAALPSGPNWRTIKQSAPALQQARSSMHGWGLFALEDIGRRAVVIGLAMRAGCRGSCPS